MRKDELDKAAAQIKRAVPAARLQWDHFGFGLSVAHADRQQAFVVYRPARADIGQQEVVGDVDAIVAALQK